MPVTQPGFIIPEVPLAQQEGALISVRVKSFMGTPAAVETAMNLWLDALPGSLTGRVAILDITQSQHSANNMMALVRYAVKE